MTAMNTPRLLFPFLSIVLDWAKINLKIAHFFRRYEPDQSNSYEVTVKTIEMHEGKEKETLKSFHIKAGDKKHLGCSLSDVMPLTSYKRVIVKETQ